VTPIDRKDQAPHEQVQAVLQKDLIKNFKTDNVGRSGASGFGNLEAVRTDSGSSAAVASAGDGHKCSRSGSLSLPPKLLARGLMDKAMASDYRSRTIVVRQANGVGDVGSGTTAILIFGSKLVFINNTGANPAITWLENALFVEVALGCNGFAHRQKAKGGKLAGATGLEPAACSVTAKLPKQLT
jgi:hypothetical protein